MRIENWKEFERDCDLLGYDVYAADKEAREIALSSGNLTTTTIITVMANLPTSANISVALASVTDFCENFTKTAFVKE